MYIGEIGMSEYGPLYLSLSTGRLMIYLSVWPLLIYITPPVSRCVPSVLCSAFTISHLCGIKDSREHPRGTGLDAAMRGLGLHRKRAS